LGAGAAGAAERLIFGDQWDPFYQQLSAEEPELMPPGWREVISLPPPPDDGFTRSEVDYIIALKPLRSRYQDDIDAQIKDVVQPFADGLKLNETQLAALRKFWATLLPEVTRVTMHFKAKFDRARPRQYSKEVDPSIAPPGHPAYPSGHSTDAHTLALLLSGIWPENKSQLLSIAHQIAANREIAGVHYRSDTAAGYLLAQQIVALLPDNPKAKSLIAAQKSALTSGDDPSQGSGR
jgi:acid phosphatase (class A)